MLVELCVSAGLAIANTFIENPPESQITYYNVGSSPSAAVRHENFAQLDLLLMPPGWLSRVAWMRSDRSEALASHHFLVEYSLQCAVAKTTSQKPVTFDSSALQHPLTRR